MSDNLCVLTDSLEAVKQHFNQNKNKWRFITLLSPT
jgi:hypothetical protein